MCTSIEGLNSQGFYTCNITNMSSMFASCSKLSELDIYNFDTTNVTDMNNMFLNCEMLKTIKASGGFVVDVVVNDSAMFSGCESLVGGSGTTYAGATPIEKDTKKYAHIDGGAVNPGYFTNANHLYYGISEENVLYISDHKSSNTPIQNDKALNSVNRGDCG